MCRCVSVCMSKNGVHERRENIQGGRTVIGKPRKQEASQYILAATSSLILCGYKS